MMQNQKLDNIISRQIVHKRCSSNFGFKNAVDISKPYTFGRVSENLENNAIRAISV
jgi:hypothetical protein